jgi:hypothetical protein
MTHMLHTNDNLSTTLFDTIGQDHRIGILRMKGFLLIAGFAVTAVVFWML